jgi:hypothetical protein
MKSALSFHSLIKNNFYFLIQTKLHKKTFKENSIALMRYKKTHIISIFAEISWTKVYMTLLFAIILIKNT